MASKWRKAKASLGLNLCVFGSSVRTDDDDDITGRFSDASSAAAMTSPASSGYRALTPTTPTPGSAGLRLAKSGSRSSKSTCAICLGAMRAGHGHALFTAECSHTFHFHCIASNVKHGNRVCPICRSKWKEVPLQGPPNPSELPHGRARVNPVNWSHNDTNMNILRRVPRNDSSNRQHHHNLSNLFPSTEPITFDDDEAVDFQSESIKDTLQQQQQQPQQGSIKALDIKTFPEFPAIPKSSWEDNFTVLIHLKAPQAGTRTVPGISLQCCSTSRAPVDLVTILDISGSMAGTKLALLKRAMGFVIQNLGPSDRLSVIAFSSTARRLFPLRKMSESGRQQALQLVNSLISSGGTNIAEGLRKGAKVLEERKSKNPVCSIILLSDGQDTYTISSSGGGGAQDYRSLVPPSILADHHQVPVHTFGFGADHDSVSMHSISQTSGGTFSFIETEGVIQDAFAQCIGGLLSVVVQELRINVECVQSGVCLWPIKSGSYSNQLTEDGRMGSICVGDLYADEDRDFLVSVNIPQASNEGYVTLLKVCCSYKDPVSKTSVCLSGEEVRIQRPDGVIMKIMSIEVDRERNRVRAAEAMAEARTAAEQGLLAEAVSILETRRRIVSESLAGRSGDRLCVALVAEMREMQERMVSRQRYEASGRAYVLSGLSSHSWQRATARGDSTDSASLVHAYQTPSMADMVNRSQILSPSSFRPSPPIRPTKSFSSHPL